LYLRKFLSVTHNPGEGCGGVLVSINMSPGRI
jgi:hypothetical protein